jgi:hypothetical protein
MGRFGKELIESMRQAARLSVGKKAAKMIKQNRRSCATAELSGERIRAIRPSRMDEKPK